MTSRMAYTDRLQKIRLRVAKKHFEKKQQYKKDALLIKFPFDQYNQVGNTTQYIKRQQTPKQRNTSFNISQIKVNTPNKHRKQSQQKQRRQSFQQVGLLVPYLKNKQSNRMASRSTRYSQRSSQQKKKPIKSDTTVKSKIGRLSLPNTTAERKQITDQQNKNFFQYVMKFSYRSKKGFMPNQVKINQDSYIVFPQIHKNTWQHYFGVCDGHGGNGHYVSNFLKQNIPKLILQQKQLQKKPTQSLKNALNILNQKLKLSRIDLAFSGSTCVGVYFNQNKVYCLNVGDSRAILISKKQGKYVVKSLTNDHKPNLPLQKQRIQSRGGKVQPYRDNQNNFLGPHRVWVKGQNFPGLAMSRSFGDLVGASVGVSCQPQITQFILTQQDKIIIIASDGVFQFLTNQQISKIVQKYYIQNNIQTACDILLQKAHQSWVKQCNIIDDITFIMIFMTY